MRFKSNITEVSEGNIAVVNNDKENEGDDGEGGQGDSKGRWTGRRQRTLTLPSPVELPLLGLG